MSSMQFLWLRVLLSIALTVSVISFFHLHGWADVVTGVLCGMSTGPLNG